MTVNLFYLEGLLEDMKKYVSLQKIIGVAESQSIEWKPSLSQMSDIIGTIAALANTEGGKIFIGVSDSGQLLGVKVGKSTIENLTNKIHQSLDPVIHPKITTRSVGGRQIIIVAVKEYSDKTILAFGRPYKRVGKSTVKMSKVEYEGLILEKHKAELNFDSKICKSAKIRDISKEKLADFVKKAKQQRGLDINPNASSKEILDRLKLTKDKKITNGAMLLFGKDPQKFFLQSELKAIRFRGYDETGEMIDFKTFGDDAITLLEKAENFIFEHIPMKAWIESGKLQRQEKWLYPPDAIREGLANALAHRDYRSTGKVQVRIFDDRMEIWNPGVLPPELTFEKLKKKHDSIPRNPFIAHAFFWIKYAEEVGTGTKKIMQWCKAWGLPEPKYEEAGGSFVLTFRKSRFTEEDIAAMGLNDRQQKAATYVLKNKQIGNKEYRELNKVEKSVAHEDLSDMVVKKVLRTVGKGRALKYEMNDL